MQITSHTKQKSLNLANYNIVGLPLEEKLRTPKIYKFKDIVKGKFTTTYIHILQNNTNYVVQTS